MSNLSDKKWWCAAFVRAIKTVAQTAVATIGTSFLIQDVDWKVVLSASLLAGILSILTSIAGLPEVKLKESSKWQVEGSDDDLDEESGESEDPDSESEES